MANTASPTYRTEDGATVAQGQLVYDYYTMEPVVVGEPAGSDGWFNTYVPQDAPVWDYNLSTWENEARGARVAQFSRAKMLNGQRICTLQFAKRRGFPGV